jgi:uroporphyrinogen-III synthase
MTTLPAVAARAPSTCVLVTRPEPQASQWVAGLAALGVCAHALPLIEIAPATDADAVRSAFAGLAASSGNGAAGAALVVFVSPNAVQRFFDELPPPVTWPVGVRAACTGPGTAVALAHAGVPAAQIVSPLAQAAQFDSEALWSRLASQDWHGERICIVRGDGGRDWLADQFKAQGAVVEFVQAYHRQPSVWDVRQRGWAAAALQSPQGVCWLFSSAEGLDNLARLLPAADWSSARSLASHPRIARRARELGFGQVLEVRPELQAVARAVLQAALPA